MTNSSQEIQAQMETLRKAYLQKLGLRLRKIEGFWNQLTQAEWNWTALRSMHRLVHSMAGSGTTFGFISLSHAAQTLDVLLTAILESNQPPTALQRIQIHALLASLKQAVINVEDQTLDAPVQDTLRSARSQFDSTAYSQSSTVHQDLDSSDQDLDSGDRTRSSIQVSILDHHGQRLIYLVEEDKLLADGLVGHLDQFGYEVIVFDNWAELNQAFAQSDSRPIAMISNSLFTERPLTGLNPLKQIQATLGDQTPPIIFFSDRDDLQVRLESARAGGKAFFVQPINVLSLVDYLDELAAPQRQDPYRILIVDDEIQLATYYGLTLQRAGMVTSVVTNPLDLLPTLEEFNPDVILMDVYMPFCSGFELAAVIRQERAYVSIPIVFLSWQRDLDKHLLAMSLGGDDFLAKPIQGNHLALLLSSRAARARTLRSIMIRDSLTGLFNYTEINEQLEQELTKAYRQHQPLSLALIDLDFFKQVNDTYGHAAGDRVLKSLARLLLQQLRPQDIIGRYGGEEFAVILPNTPGDRAFQILDHIRSEFAQLLYTASSREFSVTFSCGIATFPSFQQMAELIHASDRVLYVAKERGRNQVVLAASPSALEEGGSNP